MASPSSASFLRQVQSALSQGQPRQAALLCKQILARDAHNAEARYFLGLTHALTGEVDHAIGQWEMLLRAHPGNFPVLANLGSALAQQGRHHEAIARLREALAIDGSQAQVHYNVGNSLLALGELESAAASFRQAIALQPQFPEARNNLGVAYRRAECLLEAGTEFAAALALDPSFQEAEDNLSSVVHALYALAIEQHRAGQLTTAVASYDQVLSLRPAAAEVWRDRARALESLQRLDEALNSHRRALALAPDDSGAIAGMLSCSVRSCEWELAGQSLQRLRTVASGLEAIHPFLALSVCDSPAEQLRISAARARMIHSADSLPCAAIGARSSQERRPIRLAYVSSDFRDHAVAHLLVGVLEQHDRNEFEIHAVSLQPEDKTSDIGRRLRAAVDHYHDVSEQTDADAAQFIRDLTIDIAVDLNGYTIGARPEIFARRCAPVQVSYLGYAGTTGAAYMDYLLADEIVIPEGEEVHYSERIIRLPYCYLPNDDRRTIGAQPSRAAVSLPEDGLVFCAFTNAYKITASIFDIWMRLLRELPRSVLWLRAMGPEARKNLEREAHARAVDPQRLVFAPHAPDMAEHLGRQGLADLYLDTFPYNAHSTACDALWAGVPVLTCAGNTFASRVAASALHAAGMPELITHDLGTYARKALDLAADPRQLRDLREKLAQQRLSSPLFATASHCRHLEAAYRAVLSAAS